MIAVTLVFSTLFCIGAAFLGIVIGWYANDKYSHFLQLKEAQITTHPEMYDQDGNLLKTELTALRFVLDDDYYEED